MSYPQMPFEKVCFNDKKFLIFDDLIDNESIDKLHKDFLFLPWNFAGNLISLSNSVVDQYKHNPKIKDYLKLVYDFYDIRDETLNEKYNKNFICDFILDRFLEKIKIDNIRLYRAKANFQTQFTDNFPGIHNTPHVDFIDMPHYVLIYYVNDSDGDTILFDKEENVIGSITPKAGRFLFFNGNILHASSNPYKSDYRIVVNYDFDI